MLCINRGNETKKLMKILRILFIVLITCMTLFFVIRKYYAMSDSRLLKYAWKSYNLKCKNDFIEITKEDLGKIGKEWKLTYRWIDNSVFLHIKNDNSEDGCVYISK